ncbi:MAG: PEGA domain-containing protein, partial [Myxococcota bacterium]|nr:PEGA domain-containing protein [Myxococcota bacterium]
VRSRPPGARVRVDGNPVACRAPCALELAPGEHVVSLSLDAREDAHRVVRAEAGEPVELAVDLEPASPEIAAAQWRARHGEGIETWASLRLLQSAVRDRRVALLIGEPEEDGLRLRASLAIDGARPRRIERLAGAEEIAETTRATLRDLLVQAGLVPPRPLYEEPLFWAAAIGAAALAAGITAIVLYQPDVQHPVFVVGRSRP